jgi:hypothetical protein
VGYVQKAETASACECTVHTDRCTGDASLLSRLGFALLCVQSRPARTIRTGLLQDRNSDRLQALRQPKWFRDPKWSCHPLYPVSPVCPTLTWRSYSTGSRLRLERYSAVGTVRTPLQANCCAAAVSGAYEHRQTSDMQGLDLQPCSPRRCQILLARRRSCRRSSAAECHRRMHAVSKLGRRQSEPARLVWWRSGSRAKAVAAAGEKRAPVAGPLEPAHRRRRWGRAQRTEALIAGVRPGRWAALEGRSAHISDASRAKLNLTARGHAH